MSYRARALLQHRVAAFRVHNSRLRHKSEASGPQPSLVDVFERHPEWRIRLIRELGGTYAGPEPVSCCSRGHRRDVFGYRDARQWRCRKCQRDARRLKGAA